LPRELSHFGIFVKPIYFLCLLPKSIFSHGQLKLQELLRAQRVATGMNQTELAKKLGRPQSFVSKYESGERRLDLVELHQICRAMKVPFSKFAQKFEEALK
jgi:ribosome-binding protein aMBF1 (putative translation factor)